MNRINMKGRGQALDGDLTTTGAICIASTSIFKVNGRRVLREGDVTTPCPRCNKSGTVVEGMPGFMVDGRRAAMDGARVTCGCDDGCRVIAPLGGALTSPRAQPVATPSSAAPSPKSPEPVSARYQQSFTAAAQDTMEPGFYIVPRSMSYEQVLANLSDPQTSLPHSMLQRLNPTYQQGFKAGEIFIIGDPTNGHTCTRQELQAMSAAQVAREALADLTNEEANFMMRHQADIAGLLNDVSLSVGVAQTMMAGSLERLQATLRNIELLHQREFTKHGNLRSAEFFADRKKLFQQMDGQLRSAFLNKKMNLGSHDTMRRDLGISSKSLVHHWTKAGVAGQIPGYATHLGKLARMSKYLERGGQIGIIVGAGSSYLKIEEACRFGETKTCRRVRLTEAGSFSLGLAGGTAGGKVASAGALYMCLGFGPVGAPICGIALIGGGALVGGVVGMSVGEAAGEFIFEVTEP